MCSILFAFGVPGNFNPETGNRDPSDLLMKETRRRLISRPPSVPFHTGIRFTLGVPFCLAFGVVVRRSNCLRQEIKDGRKGDAFSWMWNCFTVDTNPVP